MSLLNKARSIEIGNRIRADLTPEEIELAIAWARGEVASIQAQRALGDKTTTAIFYSRMALALKEAVKEGLLK